jgi:archaellum component FlaC
MIANDRHMVLNNQPVVPAMITNDLLSLMKEIVPSEKHEWQLLERQYNNVFSHLPHLIENLCKKFNTLKSQKPNTGESIIPGDIEEAKYIAEMIKAKSLPII